MSSQVFPSLSGMSIEVNRDAMWDDGSQRLVAVSGKETSIAYWANPRWQWELKYEYLRQGVRYGTMRTELATLAGFFNQMRGMFDTFLFDDTDDDSVTDQAIGSGDGSTLAFQLVRAYGGFIEPVLAPNIVTNVKVNGVVISSANYTVSTWGSSAPGVVTFGAGHAPGAGQPVTATFTYYWPCAFTDKSMSFNKFLNTLYAGKSVKFKSVK